MLCLLAFQYQTRTMGVLRGLFKRNSCNDNNQKTRLAKDNSARYGLIWTNIPAFDPKGLFCGMSCIVCVCFHTVLLQATEKLNCPICQQGCLGIVLPCSYFQFKKDLVVSVQHINAWLKRLSEFEWLALFCLITAL